MIKHKTGRLISFPQKTSKKSIKIIRGLKLNYASVLGQKAKIIFSLILQSPVQQY